jgi:demethylmenaquinone methyltransferase/2-methoxy-6-polyprenyl-1,4-benzoquinol methylase
MANRFYKPGGQRAATTGDLFAAIARRYDVMNDLQSLGLHRLWKRRLVRLARVRPGEQALDVCCGTGDIAFALAQRGVSVVGLDFSEPMLAVAKARRQPAMGREWGRPVTSPGDTLNPRFLKGDALHIPFSDGTFDIVTVGYGLRNLADWETGLREMQRVARPGGRLLVLDFGKPDNALVRGVYFAYLKWIVPALGRWVCGNADAYAYILESLRHYAAQEGVAVRMRGIGLVNVRVVNMLGGMMSIHYGEKPGAQSSLSHRMGEGGSAKSGLGRAAARSLPGRSETTKDLRGLRKFSWIRFFLHYP